MRSSCLLALVAAVFVVRSSVVAQHNLVSSRIEQRVVKYFDFEERDEGNYEPEPMHWNRIETWGYPRFTRPGFDMGMGRAAPPSFRLDLAGGNVGSTYLAKDIPVHPDSDYQINAWIKPDRLMRSSAHVSVFFLDHALKKIESTERRSSPVRSDRPGDPWTSVTVDLPGGHPHARWIGLACIIEQPDPAPPSAIQPRPINLRDATGRAWFDDIAVLRLPKASLTLATQHVPEAGNVFAHDEKIECRVRVGDPTVGGLTVRWTLHDAEDVLLLDRRLAMTGNYKDQTVVDIPDLPAGLYVAKISILSENDVLVARTQPFLRLGPELSPAGSVGQGFGVMLDQAAVHAPETTARLLRLLQPSLVSVEMWHEKMDDETVVLGDPRLDRVLEAARRHGAAIAAILVSPPASLAAQFDPLSRSLLDVLTAPPRQWRPYLALVLSRYGPLVRYWQVGPVGLAGRYEPDRLAEVIAQIRAEVKPLVTTPAIAVPGSVLGGVDPVRLGADAVVLDVPESIASAHLRRQLVALGSDTAMARFAVIQPGDATRYQRTARLAEFARRLVICRTAGCESVLIPQPWRAGSQSADQIAPLEEFGLFRTLAQTLGGLQPYSPIWIAEDADAWLFTDARSGTGALVAWSWGDAPEARSISTVLTNETRIIDLWGNVTKPRSDSDGRAFDLGPMPVVLVPVVPWQFQLQASFRLEDPVLQPSLALQEHTLMLTNPRPERMRGTLRLEARGGCAVQPARIPLDLEPGAVLKTKLGFKIPSNQSAGRFELLGRVVIQDDQPVPVTLRAPFEITTPDLGVDVLLHREGERVRILHRICNRSESQLSLRSLVTSPNQPRESRLIPRLGPGQTAVREFEILLPPSDKIQYVRVSVEQVDGPLVHHEVVQVN